MDEELPIEREAIAVECNGDSDFDRGMRLLKCPRCEHAVLRVVRDAEICDECGYTRRNVPVPAVSVPVSAYQPRPGT